MSCLKGDLSYPHSTLPNDCIWIQAEHEGLTVCLRMIVCSLLLDIDLQVRIPFRFCTAMGIPPSFLPHPLRRPRRGIMGRHGWPC